MTRAGSSTAIRDLEDASAAHERVRAEIDAQDPRRLAALNVDVVRATSVVLGVVPRLLTLRERAARLAEFEIRCLDRLSDYAKAVLFLHVTQVPAVAQDEDGGLAAEALALRAKLLMWAAPLAGAGKFSREAVAKITGGQGHRDAASDVVALVALYRSVWEEVRGMCGVTAEDLERGAKLGAAWFVALSRQEHQAEARSDHSVRLKQAWTLLDHAYRQCQRVVAYLRFSEGDARTFAPSLRKNKGVRPRKRSAAAPESAPGPSAPAPTPAG